jgi:hypothetical protein
MNLAKERHLGLTEPTYENEDDSYVGHDNHKKDDCLLSERHGETDFH